MEPEVVATSPYRSKSPVPVYCGLDSLIWLAEPKLSKRRLVLATGLAPALATFEASHSDNLSYGSNTNEEGRMQKNARRGN
jgi:hypothetical protein